MITLGPLARPIRSGAATRGGCSDHGLHMTQVGSRMMLPMKPLRQLMLAPCEMIHDIRKERAPCGSRGLITRRLTRRPIVDVPSQGCGTTPPIPPFSMTQSREAPASVFRTMNPWIPTRARGCRVCQSDCRIWPVRNKLSCQQRRCQGQANLAPRSVLFVIKSSATTSFMRAMIRG